MYCVNGNSSWYIICRPLFGGCPLLGVSVIGGSTGQWFAENFRLTSFNGSIVQRIIPILSPLVFMPSLYSSFHNSKNFLFTSSMRDKIRGM